MKGVYSMVSVSNPHLSHTYLWWMHEASISEEDGHLDAARAAYAQALKCARTDYDAWLARKLLDGLSND